MKGKIFVSEKGSCKGLLRDADSLGDPCGEVGLGVKPPQLTRQEQVPEKPRSAASPGGPGRSHPERRSWGSQSELGKPVRAVSRGSEGAASFYFDTDHTLGEGAGPRQSGLLPPRAIATEGCHSETDPRGAPNPLQDTFAPRMEQNPPPLPPIAVGSGGFCLPRIPRAFCFFIFLPA